MVPLVSCNKLGCLSYIYILNLSVLIASLNALFIYTFVTKCIPKAGMLSRFLIKHAYLATHLWLMHKLSTCKYV